MPGDWSNDELSSEGDQGGASELRDLEDELCRLTGVHAVRVVGDRSGRPIEVHVLADPSKPAKQTVRDVRAVAQTVFGIELDHRIVSVAQLNTNDQNTPVGIELPRAEARARVGSINVEAVGLRAQVRVVLVDNEHELTGYAEGSIASRGASAARRHCGTRRRSAGGTRRGGDPHHQRRHQPHWQQPRRGGHRCVRRPTDRARRVRVRGRAS